MTKAEIIEGMLNLVNGPEKWCKYTLYETVNEVERYCLLGALMKVTSGDALRWSVEVDGMIDLFDDLAVTKGYGKTYERPSVEFNNAPETEYEDLRLFLKEALERVA